MAVIFKLMLNYLYHYQFGILMVKKFKEKLKHHFQEVLKTKTSPHSIALGFAIGTLIDILPTLGFGFFLGLLVGLIFEKVNKYSLFGAIILCSENTTFLKTAVFHSSKMSG